MWIIVLRGKEQKSSCSINYYFRWGQGLRVSSVSSAILVCWVKKLFNISAIATSSVMYQGGQNWWTASCPPLILKLICKYLEKNTSLAERMRTCMQSPVNNNQYSRRKRQGNIWRINFFAPKCSFINILILLIKVKSSIHLCNTYTIDTNIKYP